MWPFAGYEDAQGFEIVLRCAVALLMGFVGVGAILMMGFVILTWVLDLRKPVMKKVSGIMRGIAAIISLALGLCYWVFVLWMIFGSR